MAIRKVNMTTDELLALPTAVDIVTAGHAIGVSRTTAYQLAKTDQFPVPVMKLGNTYRVPTAYLLRFLGVDIERLRRDHTHDTPRPTSAKKPANRRGVGPVVVDFSEPVTMRTTSGKEVVIDPTKNYRVRGRKVSGAELLRRRRND